MHRGVISPWLLVPGGMRGAVTMDFNVGGMTGANWPAANRAYYVPFRPPANITVTAMQAFCTAGTTTNDWDVGLYNDDYTAIVRQGAADLGANDIVTFTFTNPLRLKAGKLYYAGMSLASTNGMLRWAPSSNVQAFSTGLRNQASAHPLPDPMVPSTTVSSTYCPVIGLVLALT